jgi:AcrR family transcriptional regulator
MPSSRTASPAPAARPARRCRPGVRAGEGLRERNKRLKWGRIQRAARELFERDGFEATTARAIAARAGVGTGTLFLYARDKRELLFRVFQDEARRLFAEAAARAAERPEASLVDALMDLFARFLDFYAARPALASALLRELFFRPYEPERLGALTREYADQVLERVERARVRGELRRDVATEAAAQAFFAHYAFWTQAWLGSRQVSRARAERGLRAALQLQVDGLRAPRRRRTP